VFAAFQRVCGETPDSRLQPFIDRPRQRLRQVGILPDLVNQLHHFRQFLPSV